MGWKRDGRGEGGGFWWKRDGRGVGGSEMSVKISRNVAELHIGILMLARN